MGDFRSPPAWILAPKRYIDPMIVRRLLTASFGQMTVAMDVIEENTSFDQGLYHQLTSTTWRRAARLIERFGADEALAELDRRAESCVDRRDVPSAIRWRNVMAAIHAISSGECAESRMN
ncbi:hypothetical protein [Bradyrhizobium mercantei]|uniref:hypothetical protein n=1 Tax=Bradyrhizobium mercantei TaxID=1904807 RepID=UPI000976B53F|nr:hypothetical protein [Bradyrhizobium mercantei]